MTKLESLFNIPTVQWLIGCMYRIGGRSSELNMSLPAQHIILNYEGNVVANAAVIAIDVENAAIIDKPVIQSDGPVVLEFTGDWPKTDNAEHALISVGKGGNCLLSLNGLCIIAGKKLTIE